MCMGCVTALSGFGQAESGDVPLSDGAIDNLKTGGMGLILAPVIGSILGLAGGALAWKAHRGIGGFLGFMAGGSIGGVLGFLFLTQKIEQVAGELEPALNNAAAQAAASAGGGQSVLPIRLSNASPFTLAKVGFSALTGTKTITSSGVTTLRAPMLVSTAKSASSSPIASVTSSSGVASSAVASVPRLLLSALAPSTANTSALKQTLSSGALTSTPTYVRPITNLQITTGGTTSGGYSAVRGW